MTVSLSLLAGSGWQFFDNSGDVLTGGLLYSYTAGTTTPAATYTSVTGLTANSNPIVLDAAGRVPNQIWLTDGAGYKFRLENSVGTQIGSWDNITSQNTASVGLSASAISYTAAGSSTVRTVQAKLEETVSVQDFGAVGNGVTNDAAAINSALAAGVGGVVTLGRGLTYLINQTIYVPNGTVFDLNYSTLVDGTGALEIMVELAGRVNVVVRRGTIDGGVRTSIGPHCISGVAAKNCLVQEVKFIRFGRSPLQPDSLGPSGTGVMFMANDDPAFVLGPTVGPSYGNTIENCVFDDIRASFAGRIWSSWDYAGVTSECYGNQFRNNLVLNIGKTACEMAGPKTYSCSATDNTVHNARIDGIDIDKGASRCIISGNKIYSVDQYPSYASGLQFGGISVSSVNDPVGGLLQGDNNIVCNNIIYAAREVGIRIAGANNTTVSGNHILSFGANAISVENTPGTSIAGANTLISNNVVGEGGSFQGSVISAVPTDIIVQCVNEHVVEGNILTHTNYRGIWSSAADLALILNNTVIHYPTATAAYAIYSVKSATILGNTVQQANSFVNERTIATLGTGMTVSICNNTIDTLATYGIISTNDTTSNVLIAGNTITRAVSPIRVSNSVTNLVIQNNMIEAGKSITYTANSTSVVRQGKAAAIPNTSGATLAQLETEVNTIKAALRTLSIISI